MFSKHIKNVANYVGFEYVESLAQQSVVVYCLFSGGLPSPLPTYIPEANSTQIKLESGPIGSHDSSSPYAGCYALNAATGAPTKAPAQTSSPTSDVLTRVQAPLTVP